MLPRFAYTFLSLSLSLLLHFTLLPLKKKQILQMRVVFTIYAEHEHINYSKRSREALRKQNKTSNYMQNCPQIHLNSDRRKNNQNVEHCVDIWVWHCLLLLLFNFTVAYFGFQLSSLDLWWFLCGVIRWLLFTRVPVVW